MFKKELKKFKKSGTFYRRVKKNKERYETYLRNLYSDSDRGSNRAGDCTQLLQQSCSISGLVNRCEMSLCQINPSNSVKTTDNAEHTHCPSSYSTPETDDFENCTIIKEYSRNSSNVALQQWAIKHNINHQAVKELLTIIKHEYSDTGLPTDPRTLLHTPKTTAVVNIPGGQYWHQGLETCLRNAFKDLDQNIVIQLNVNVDGLPIHKSSKHQLWPILCNIHQMPHIKPMAVGIFLGKSKPLSVSDYLKPFIDELIPMMASGLTVNEKIIEIKIRCFICDSPARAFLKGKFFVLYFKLHSQLLLRYT
ncbi:uncharacterized protein LOC134212057 isoform X2 [Armigeres subalbatus]|uniref:uncharacterized protein LOC134212057 isoform X2 n=1 Tax=Armigeres subalbatus TaxID=124917 RepID=UPI002ED4D07A